MQIPIDIPDGKSGDWEVKTFEVSEEAANSFNMRQLFQGTSNRGIEPGIYKKLTCKGQTIMSNTPAEIKDHLYFIRTAQRKGGNILINGLGLGVALKAILEFDNVTSVTVIEKEQDVINLVADTYSDPRVLIIHADALEFKPNKGMKYSVVWHDIWPSICSDNNDTMNKLHRKYGRRSDWQGSWGRNEIKRMIRRDSKW